MLDEKTCVPYTTFGQSKTGKCLNGKVLNWTINTSCK